MRPSKGYSPALRGTAVESTGLPVAIGERDFKDFSQTATYFKYFSDSFPTYLKTAVWKGIVGNLTLDIIEELIEAIRGTVLFRRDRSNSRIVVCEMACHKNGPQMAAEIRIQRAKSVSIYFYSTKIDYAKDHITNVLIPRLNKIIEPYTTQPEESNLVNISFCMSSMEGANIMSRRLMCPSWKEIQGNYPYNNKQIDSLFKLEHPDRHGKFIFWHGMAGTGKCLSFGTPILKFNGDVVPVETIKVGDLLMGPDSKPRKVLSTTKGYGKMYEVTPTKGDSYTVNDNHVLSLKYSGKEKIINIPIKEYLQDVGTSRFRLKGWRTGVDWNKQEVSIPPYILGMWLGDGSNKQPIIHTADQEVVTELEMFVSSNNLELSKYYENRTASSYRIISSHTSSINPFLENLKSLNVMGNKHIPQKYLINDRNTRLELLAGLIDSDGHLSNSGYEITTKYPKLRDGILFIARSLGFAAYSKEKESHCQTGGGGIYQRIFISGDISQIPVRIERKKAAPRQQVKDVLKTGISVDHADDGEYFGFELDGDSLFLLGDFTVTHNSFLIRAALQKWKTNVRCMYIVDPENFFNNANYMQEILLHRPEDADEDDDMYAVYDDEEYNQSPEGSKFRLLIIEDGLNNLLTETRNEREGAVSRFLNLTDGILGQGLRLIFLVTSNEKINKIDDAFLRKGRCLQELEFPQLGREDAQKWLIKMGKKIQLPDVVGAEYSLADLYSYIDGGITDLSKKSETRKPGFL